MLKIETIVVTPFQQNARLLWDTETRAGVIVDPGGDADKILSIISRYEVKLEAIWLTHSHLDHCGGVKRLKELNPAVPVYGHRNERMLRENVVELARAYGLARAGLDNCPEPDHFLEGGETLHVGGTSFEVSFVPGHSPGHLCFYAAQAELLLAGDTLFAGSIGRTDLPGGDHALLIRGIERELLTLPDTTRVMPGHGPDTSIGAERESNPFLNEER